MRIPPDVSDSLRRKSAPSALRGGLRSLREPTVCASCLLGVCLVAASTSCSGDQLAVRVHVPSDVSPTGIDLRLMSLADSGCVESPLARGKTDRAGEERLRLERSCGPAWLIASQRGLTAEQRRVDTCQMSSLELRMSSRPSSGVADAPGSDTARDFVDALVREDWGLVSDLLAVPEDVDLYHAPGIRRRSTTSELRVDPWRAEVLSTRVKAGMNDVVVALDYDDGCRSTWLIVLLGSTKGWRVALLQPMSDAQLFTDR